MLTALKRISSATVPVLLVIATASCGEAGDSASGTWSGSERDSAGVRIVENGAIGTWREATRWRVERDLEIGVVDGPPEYQFGSIVDLDAGEDGRIYVLDRLMGNVRVYDADGTFLSSFGGFGEGPGEFSSRTEAILVGSGGDVLVPDMGLHRASVFRPDGTLLGSFPIPYPDRRPPGEWAAVREAGYLNHFVTSDWTGLVRYDERGELVDSVIEFSRGRPTSIEGWRVLPPVPLWAVSGSGRILAASTHRYAIEIRGADGNLEMVFSRMPEVEPIPAPERQRLADLAWEGARRALADDADVAWWESRYPRSAFLGPDHVPMMIGLEVGPNGTIWVQRAPPLDSIGAETLKQQFEWTASMQSARWEVFSRDGRFLGEVILPPRFTVHRIKHGYIYGTEEGEYDVQRVVRLRLHVPG